MCIRKVGHKIYPDIVVAGFSNGQLYVKAFGQLPLKLDAKDYEYLKFDKQVWNRIIVEE